MSKDLPIASDEKLHTITNEILRLIEKKPDFTHFDLKETLRKSFDWNTISDILAEYPKLKKEIKELQSLLDKFRKEKK